MKLRQLAIGVSSLAIFAGSLAGLGTPAYAVADVTFSPTTDLVPGTTLSNAVVSTSSGPLCVTDGEGTESNNGNAVYFGIGFYDSADQTYDGNDEYIGFAEGAQVSYQFGATTSPSFSASVPVLERHNSANYIVAVGYCYDYAADYSVTHGDGVVVTYSDLTFVTPNAAQGSTATAHIIDDTSPGQFCDTANNTGPFSIALEFYSSWASYDNSDDPVVMLPTTWSQGNGGGIGSFSAADFSAGVNVDFIVPSDLPVGQYEVYAFCIASDGYSAGDSIGLQPFSVTAPALPETGIDTSTVAGIAAGAAGLITIGAMAFVVRRRSVKA